MLHTKSASEYLKQLKKYKQENKSNEASDNFHTIARECTEIINEDKGFKKFRKSYEFKKLCAKIAEICPNGILPEYTVFIVKYSPDGLTVNQNRYLRQSVKYFLLKTVAEQNMRENTVINDIVKSFFILKDYNYPKITTALCKADRIFRTEKAGIYPQMSYETKIHYLLTAEKCAQKQKINTEKYASDIVSEADKKNVHIGFLMPIYSKKTKEGKALIIITYILSFLISVIVSLAYGNIFIFLLTALPITEILLLLMQKTAFFRRKPRHICRMDKSTVNSNPCTAIAVSSILPKSSDIEKTEKHLKQLYISNSGSLKNICLLADLPAADRKEKSTDSKDIQSLKRMIDKLNIQFGDKFTLAVRERVFSQTEQEYIAPERKRGAVLALTEYLSTGKNRFSVLYGAEKALFECEYLMLLDSDTSIGFEALCPIIAAAMHPLNKPQTDTKTNTVKSGYGIYAPNCTCSVKSFSESYFSRDMCLSGGTSAYLNTSNDFYSDFFGNGIFCGKGLIHAETFYKTINGRFPDEKMLSHDIAEGIVMRVLPITDITLTDDFPKTETAYYKRENRWVRGDIQNIPLLKRKPVFLGKEQYSPFSFDARYKLFDNIRRAITPIFALLGIILSVFFSNKISAFICTVCLASAACGEIIGGISSLLNGGIRALSGLYKEDALPEALSSFNRAFLKCTQIYINAVNSLDASLRSIWRMTVSKKHLLSWTTAAASNGRSDFKSVLIPRIPLCIISLFLFLSKKPMCIICSLLFIFDIFYAYFSQREIKIKYYIPTEEDISFIREEEAEMWQYFFDNFKEEYNYLIPDNISVSPLPDIAARTSPTNIGLSLCVFLAGRDMNFIDSKTLYFMLDNSLNTIEGLEKWHGNLINWYDIKTKKALSPKYASFVDSGNFICCITALKEGLFKYINEEPKLAEIAVRLEKIKKECKLSAFYNKNRRLFSIGYDIEKQEFTNSFYDLLMSEARMASFIAVAEKQVPAEHWYTLSRTTAKCGRYSGALSWSGTMFEYFMPYIFLPSPKNTLTDESLWFCLKCQMKYAEKYKIPWGISESCYYSFNEALNYNYKANGVPDLGLKRSSGTDLTVSPYSVFLTLPFSTKQSLLNLKKLKRYPLKGKYGFYEAIDFNRERTGDNGNAVVRCFMVHHIGMSILSCENALKDMIWQKRFMKNTEAGSAESLFCERIPPNMRYYKNPDKEIPAKLQDKQRYKTKKDIPSAAYELNGVTGAFHKTGCMMFLYSGINVLRENRNIINYPSGIFAGVKNKNGTVSFTKAPSGNKNTVRKAVFEKDKAVYTATNGELKLTEKITFGKEYPCITVNFKIKNTKKTPYEGALSVFFEPSLAPLSAERAHRAYSKLFIKSRPSAKCNGIIFERTAENESASLIAGFTDADFQYTTDKEAVFSPVGGIHSLYTQNTGLNNRPGSVDCCFYAETHFSLGGEKEISFNFLLALGENSDEAENSFIYEMNNPKKENRPCKLFIHNSPSDALSSSLLSDTVFSSAPYKNRIEYINGEYCINDLWSLGISGDHPLIIFDADKTDISSSGNFINAVNRMNSVDLRIDLAVLYSSKNEYRKSPEEEYLSAMGLNGSGQNGIFIINKINTDRKILEAVYIFAAAIYPSESNTENNEPTELYSLPGFNPDSKKAEDTELGFFVPAKPPVPWCATIANRSFGCLVSDRNLGYTWSMNSAENKLTEWTNDPYSDTCSEILTVFYNDRHYDIISGAAANLGGRYAEWYSHCDDCIFTVKISVPEKGMRKDIKVKAKNIGIKNFCSELYYTVNPTMGRNSRSANFITKEKYKNGIIFHNTFNRDFSGYLYIHSENAEFTESLKFKKNYGISQGISAKLQINLKPNEEKTFNFSMTYALNKNAAVKLAELSLEQQEQPKININSGDKNTDILVNKYLINQTEITRIYSRCAFYQAGGAYGFRDQLQDCLNIVKIKPELLKYQIFRSAASQFEQGDVLHWWHITLPNGKQEKRGIRTRCSDDLLWLPYAVAEYADTVRNNKILNTEIPFINGDILKSDETDRYFTASYTNKKSTLYGHCLRAIEKAYTKGPHGLLLIGSGDWNDSFNIMGINGNGESIWLTQFFIMTLKKFIPLMHLKKDEEKIKKYESVIADLYANLDKYAWDNDRYIRCFYDDGTPMGSKSCKNSEIDLLPQSFASLCDMPDKERVKTALMTAYNLLVDKDSRIIKLFTPPFNKKSKPTGYVNYYPEGVRENGGQYTHSAVWFIKALYKEGFIQEAKELISLINPLNKIENNNLTGMYRNEPYALSGDVYSLKNYKGRGGWSLYTGAAGWLLSTAEEIFKSDENNQQNINE